jgi:hypothetical protein
MARDERDLRNKESTPPRLAETTPQVYPGQNYDFTLQAVFEMQKTMGQFTQAIQTLTEEAKDSKKTLSRLSHIIYAAAAVLAVLVTVGGWILSRVWELIEPALKLVPR